MRKGSLRRNRFRVCVCLSFAPVPKEERRERERHTHTRLWRKGPFIDFRSPKEFPHSSYSRRAEPSAILTLISSDIMYTQ